MASNWRAFNADAESLCKEGIFAAIASYLS